MLGCNVSKTVGSSGAEGPQGLKLSCNWTACAVPCNGTDKTKQQAPLRKKITEYRDSQGYQLAEKIQESARKKKLQNIAADMQREQRVVTYRFFRTAY
jgi:hypothetical protein